MDTLTDSKIQRAVKKEFVANTVLTIAHRLETIADSDLIVVLGDGRVLEQGSTLELLNDVDGEFRSLVDQLGPERREALMSAAKGK